MEESADRSRRSLGIVLGGAAIWALVTLALLVAGKGNGYLFLFTVVPAAALAYVSWRRGTKPWAWLALIISLLDLLIMIAALLYYLFTPDKSAGDPEALGAWPLVLGSLLMTVGAFQLRGDVPGRSAP